MERKKKILIVDDEMTTVQFLKHKLRFEGYDTAEACDGKEGLEQVAEYNPDLVILDVMMPEIDGYEVCRQVKSNENTKHIPIIMLTGKTEVESRVKGLNIGADDYLSKPFNYEELSARVRSLITAREARERLVEEGKSEALEQMMGEVEHGMRNPLTSIGGFARRVHERLPEGDPNRKYMELIINDVARLENMVNQLLELKSMVISYRKPTNINDVIMAALEFFEQEIKDNSVELKTDLEDNPPLIPVDGKQIKRAVANLIKNSIEAMHEKPKILKISSYIKDGRISVQVSDTGKGIPKDKTKNVFDPFFTSKTSGPGLGLTATLKIIQEHKGFIYVESEPGKGTTFTITLPL